MGKGKYKKTNVLCTKKIIILISLIGYRKNNYILIIFMINITTLDLEEVYVVNKFKHVYDSGRIH